MSVEDLLVGLGLLETTTIVSEAILNTRVSTAIRLKRLHLALERVIYALPLVGLRMIEALWACYRLHGHIRAQRHALMNMASRWKRVSSLLLWIVTVCAGILTVAHPILANLLHRWQLEFLVVKVVGFFTSVAFSLTRKFFIQVYA